MRFGPMFTPLVLFAAAPVTAQVPGTDIFLVPLTTDGSRLTLGAPVNLTARPGYDNQPAFTPDGTALLFTRIAEDGQADVWRVDLASRAVTRVTRTSESEYSPVVSPDGGISVVRVERDSAQRLWRFNAEGDAPLVVLPGLAPVGYYAWTPERRLLAFVLGSPPALVLADPGTGRVDTVAMNVGRSIHRIPGGATLSFVQREGDGGTIMEFDPAARTRSALVAVVPGSQDLAWTPDGAALMADGPRVLRWQRGAGAWAEVGRLEAPGLGAITRLAVSPDGRWLAVVAAEPGVAP